MGLLQPKGPNPHETNVNSPRYTPASQASKRATEMGISGDAATLLGRGFEEIFIQSDMEFKTSAGDFAYIGNRVGMVSAVTKNVTTQKIETITVVEDLGALPLDWRETPADFGYDDNGPGSTTKTTTYAIDPSVAREVINSGGLLLTTGKILICRKRTTDKTTWPKVAQSASLFQDKFAPAAASVKIIENIVLINVSDYEGRKFNAVVLPELSVQDVIWTIETNPGSGDIEIDTDGTILTEGMFADSDQDLTVTATSVTNPALSDTAVLRIVAS